MITLKDGIAALKHGLTMAAWIFGVLMLIPVTGFAVSLLNGSSLSVVAGCALLALLLTVMFQVFRKFISWVNRQLDL